MTGNVHYLHGRPREIAYFTRVGFSEHRQVEHLLSVGAMSATRFVIEAANFKRQTSLIRTLRDEKAEIVLDSNVAELSTKGRFSGAMRFAPWAAEDRPLDNDDFVDGTNRSIIEPINRFAIDNGVGTVMAPTHYLGDGEDRWFRVDQGACEALRRELDRRGGENTVIDYPLIVTYAQLRDPDTRKNLVSGLQDLPFDFLWLRVSGFGADATAAGVERYMQALFDFHALGKPIIKDHVGGLASLAISAFGAASGIAHAITGKERFTAAGWVNPKAKKRQGLGGKTVHVQGPDRRMKIGDARKLFDDARTSRKIFGCPDKSCCGDIDKMLSNPEAHFVRQRARQVNDLSNTPESLRSETFVTSHVEQARRRADRAMKLKKADDNSKKMISKSRRRLIRLENVLVNLQEQLGPVEYAAEASTRAFVPEVGLKETEGLAHE